MTRMFFWIGLALTLFLSGCAQYGHNTALLPRLDQHQMAVGDGVVAISFSTNIHQADNFQALVIDQLADDGSVIDNYVIYAEEIRSGKNTGLFTSAMPAGRYKFRELRTSYSSDFYRFIELKKLQGFTIKPKGYADLGRIIVTQKTNSWMLVLRDFQSYDHRQLFEKIQPAYHRLTAEMSERGGWSEEVTDKEKMSARIVRFLTQSLNNPVSSEEGILAGGSELGQVLLRSPTGRWQNIDTGSVNSIMHTAFIGPASVVAAGEFMSLFKFEGRKVSRVDTTGLPIGEFTYLRHKENIGTVLGIWSADHYYLYKTVQLDTPKWEQLAKFDIDRKDKSLLDSLVDWEGNTYYSEQGDKLYISAYPKNFFSYNFETGEQVTGKIPEEPYAIFATENGDVFVKVEGFWGANTFRSQDQGATWVEVKGLSGQFHYTMNGQSEIFRIYDGVLEVSKDNAQTWDSIARSKGGNLILVDGDIFLQRYNVPAASSQFYHFDKDKQWWDMERETSYQNFIQSLQSATNKK